MRDYYVYKNNKVFTGPHGRVIAERIVANWSARDPRNVYRVYAVGKGMHAPNYKTFNPRRRRKGMNMGRSSWGRTEFSRGPLKSKADVKRLAARLKAKRASYAQDAGRYADRYWDSILAQPDEQRKLLDIDRRYSNPKKRRKAKRKVARRIGKRRSASRRKKVVRRCASRKVAKPRKRRRRVKGR